MSPVSDDNRIRQITVCAMMTALLCILCPLSVPAGPVPVTLGVFAVFLVSLLLPVRVALLTVVLYLLLGTFGLPVFSGYTGGPARLLGPTGGFLIGYLPLVLLTSGASARAERLGASANLENHSRVREALLRLSGMAAGLASCYLFGTLWFSVTAKVSFFAALSVCVFPFLVFDAIKIVCALVAGSLLQVALKRARLLDA